MPGADIPILRNSVRDLLRAHEESGIPPPANIEVAVGYDYYDDRYWVRMSSHEWNRLSELRARDHGDPAWIMLIQEEARLIWRQEREEHIVNHHPDVVAIRELINVTQREFNDPAHCAQLQHEHIRIERRVRDEINGANDYGWVRAQAQWGHATLRHTGIVQMAYDAETDMPGGFYRARAPTPPPPRYDDGVRGFNGMIPYPATPPPPRYDYAKAEAKGLALLKRHLTPQQKADYETYAHFHVKGGDSGKTYRIKHGTHMNVYLVEPKKPKYHPERASSVREWLFGTQPIPAPRLPKLSEYVEKCGYCFVPAGGLCAGDCMLIQKVSLETDEKAALRVANKFPVHDYGGYRY